MTSAERLGLASRAFFLATILGLALASREGAVVQATLLLAALGAAALAAGRVTFIADRWICFAEGVLAALVIGVTLPGGAVLLPYLMVPALLVGVSSGAVTVVLVAGAEMFGLLLVLALGGAPASMQDGIELAAPWAVASVGAGLVGAWIAQLRGLHDTDEDSYESARRLLSQLRTVARKLSSGLDPVSIGSQVMQTAVEHLGASRAALFVRTEGGVLAPLAYSAPGPHPGLDTDDPLVDRCWDALEPVSAPQQSGLAERRHRVVLPLRTGARMIGVVIADAPVAPDTHELTQLMRGLDEHALRLDTALVFDEVRSLATMEERQRLAREIHDGVAQEIAGLGYYVDDLNASSVSEAQRAKLRALRGEITRVVSELRLSIFDLRSEISPAAGLGSALSDYIRGVGARSDMTVHLTLDEAPTRLRSEVETELLRIAQEAVTNARKHTASANLWVDCRIQPPYASITVQDDGGGLGKARPDSYGLKIMRERAERIGAALEVGDHRAVHGLTGTRVAVTIGQQADSPPQRKGEPRE